VIPMVTYGAVSNVTDLLNLRGIDVAITQADVLDHFRREVKIPDIENMYGRRPRCKREIDYQRSVRVRSCIRPLNAAA